MKIVNPNENPMAGQMDQQAGNLIFTAFKKSIPSMSEEVTHMAEELEARLRLMKLDGPAGTWDHWDKYQKAKVDFMNISQNMVAHLAEFEKDFLTWLSKFHGEKEVLEKHKQAYEGAKRGK